ncbi:MAG: thiamine pyrophosphate-binding protein [Candidatus Dadabacteria bacterium]|nr:MAG: thiamine pyrophosphate-binding protein [Candidatus Dadabacteria bacterium]
MTITPESIRADWPTTKISGRRSGAWLVRYALEQLPVSHTFGIPGVHNTELYDELNKSERIDPVLVTHEGGGAFMADAISRTSDGRIGCMVIVPAAGATHAMSGIGEAYLDGIPLLVISGGTSTDSPFGYQLHELDQMQLVQAVTKARWRVERHEDVVPTIFAAYHTAVSGVPGPVFVELPYNVQLFQGPPGDVPQFQPPAPAPQPDTALIEQAADLLATANAPGLFVGWGAVDVAEDVARIAEMLGAPVSTTLQGLSAFPADHPLHTGMGFSAAAVPAARNAFQDVDALLAIGVRFGEIPTGSYGVRVPENLVHIDIDPAVLNRNYPAAVAIAADSRDAVPALRRALEARGVNHADRRERVATRIATDKDAWRTEWFAHKSDRVNPARFFTALRERLDRDAITVVDDGNHTFLAAEQFPVLQPRTFISPTDFNCMGYCVPAAIGAKLANPERQVAAIVGDGAFLMTCMEIVTASTRGVGVPFFVFYDGELSQISQGQEIPYNRKTCTVLGEIRLEGAALATGAHYVEIRNDDEIADGIDTALAISAKGQPVVVDVRIDYSKRTAFTQGVVKTVLKRFPLGDKFRFVGRALWRKVTG